MNLKIIKNLDISELKKLSKILMLL